MLKLNALVLFALILLSSCSGQSLNTYKDSTPKLDMHEFFSGTIKGWGMFQSRSDEVKRRFVVTIKAKHIDKDTIILDEQFSWADGERSERIWQLKKIDTHHWSGTAGDVIGKAEGKISGNALHWRYNLALKVKDKTYEVEFDDWMYLIDENTMLNRSDMNKWGFNLGSVTLSLHKQSENP